MCNQTQITDPRTAVLKVAQGMVTLDLDDPTDGDDEFEAREFAANYVRREIHPGWHAAAAGDGPARLAFI